MDTFAELLGWGGAVTSSLLAAPQALRLYRNPKDVSGIALTTWLLLLLNAIFWLAYAVLSGSYPVGVPSLINGPLAAYIVFRMITAPHDYSDTPHEPSELTKAWRRVDDKSRKD